MKFTAGGETISITCPDRDALLAEVRARLGEGRGFTLATLNVDHLEKLRHDAGFRAAYGAHDLVVADGNPIVWLSRIAGRPVKLVPGSELVEPLARIAAETAAPVALIAGSDKAADAAAAHLSRIAPGLVVVMKAAPGFPFDPVGAEAQGLAPIQDRLDAIDALADGTAIADYLRNSAARGESFLVSFGPNADFRDSKVNIAYAAQGGLGLPDRTYYFEATHQDKLAAYERHVARVLELSGVPSDAAGAR